MPSAILSTPIGPVIVTADDDHILSVRVPGKDTALTETVADEAPPLLREAIAQLTAWFGHRLQDFDLPLAPPATPRGSELRAAIRAIGYGDTASYGTVAQRIGSGPRAIGQACRRNPFPILVPCHRVIGAAQAIGYYSAGDGVETKRWLIDHERKQLN